MFQSAAIRAFVLIALPCVAALGFDAGTSQAFAQASSVTRLAGGYAYDCYQAAEFGTSTKTDICDRALKDDLSPGDLAATYFNRSALRVRAKDGVGALSDANKGLEIIPKQSEGLLNRGAALLLLRRYQEAVVDLDAAIALNVRKLEAAYYNRGIAKESIGDLQGAYFDLRTAVDINPKFELALQELKQFYGVTPTRAPSGRV
jgi:tetratricopeptide (TPR) repeat protein